MNFAFSEEQEELRATARAFLAECSSSEAVRRAMASELGFDPALWKRMAAELGWSAICVPEEHGGLGLTAVELSALLEVMGEHLLCAPFFSSVCLGANALLVAGSAEQQRDALPAIAAGERLATLALCESGALGWDAAGVEATARRAGGDYLLSGRKRFVPDGHCADLLVVAARREGTRGEEGLSLFAVPVQERGVSRRQVATLDRTRRQAEVELREVRVPAAALLGEEGAAAPLLREILDRAAVALAAEQVGGAQRCLDLSVAHAKERVQFGRPIGSFQAIKHSCAEMMMAVESARSGAYYAACVAAEGAQELPLVSPLAKATASEAFFRCAADAIQIHGGVGFTWEYDVHLYFKRARSGLAFLGEPDAHREALARRLGLEGDAA